MSNSSSQPARIAGRVRLMPLTELGRVNDRLAQVLTGDTDLAIVEAVHVRLDVVGFLRLRSLCGLGFLIYRFTIPAVKQQVA